MPDKPAMNRREFLTRTAKAGATLMAAGALAWAAHDPEGPQPNGAAPSSARIPDFSLAGASAKMSIARGADRRQTAALAMEALGGMAAFVGKGDRVLLKVNAAFASPPSLSATTHPDLVSELVRMCRAAGAASVAVTDNPINDPASCFALTGIGRAARAAGAELILPEPRLFRDLTAPGAQLIRKWPVLVGALSGATKLIGVAPVKDHHRSGASLTMKNWYGLLGGRRNIFHQNIHTIIAELAAMVRPTLVVLDGTASMIANGPTGGSLSDLKPTHTLIAGTDPVAVDAFGATLLGKSSAELPFIAKAQAAGLGTADWRALNPVEVNA